LVTIASQGETDGKVAHKTAASAAALTFAATVYLPASLLAVGYDFSNHFNCLK
jgi:hypothetical protein